MERRKFLEASIGVAALLEAGCSTKKSIAANSKSSIKLKGKLNSDISHWDIITIGNLSRNRYWGESEEKSLHSVICTCTVIKVRNFHVLVDPSLKNATEMANELKRRTGLTPDDIDVVFMTHEHEDHYIGLPNFPKAKWIASPLAAEAINKEANFFKKVSPSENSIFDVIDIIPAPGHTPGTAALRFDYKELSVCVCGDAVATKDFWDEKRMYFKGLNEKDAIATMNKFASVADIIVPGHDNYFLL